MPNTHTPFDLRSFSGLISREFFNEEQLHDIWLQSLLSSGDSYQLYSSDGHGKLYEEALRQSKIARKEKSLKKIFKGYIDDIRFILEKRKFDGCKKEILSNLVKTTKMYSNRIYKFEKRKIYNGIEKINIKPILNNIIFKIGGLRSYSIKDEIYITSEESNTTEQRIYY